MNAEQRKFINNAFCSMSIMAALQRSKTYSNRAKDSDRREFREELSQLLMKLSEKYKQEVAESKHIENIKFLAAALSDKFAHILDRGRFRIGSAQKALNSYLKYLWCAGKIVTPPHCPFDSIIIDKLPGCEGIKWTLLDDISEYRQIVSAARKKAGEETLAQWELETWNGDWQ